MNSRFCAWFVPYSAFRIPHSELRIPNSIFRIWLVCCLFAGQLVAQVPMPALPPLDSLSELQVADLARELAAIAVVQRNLADLQWHNVQSMRSSDERALAVLKADTTTLQEVISAHEKKLRSARNAEKAAQKNVRQAEKNLALAESTQTMDSLARRKSLPKVRRQLADMYPLLVPPPPVAEAPAGPVPPVVADSTTINSTGAEAPKKKDKKPEPPVRKYQTYAAQADVMLYPPPPPCTLAANRRDEFSGEIQREAARAELFRYTNPVLKTYLQGNIHILCEAALATAGQNTTLWLTFTIRDPNVRKAFGSLAKNSLASLQTLDGTIFPLYNQQLSEAVPDETGQVFTFRGQYPLDRPLLKKLRTTGLDKVRVAWSTGYEDYEVQNVDLLMQQTQCLE